MPEEVLAMVIVLSFLTFIFTIIKSTQQYKLKKMEQQTAGQVGESLTTSELRGLIQEAVGEATADLEGRLELVSARLEAIEGAGGVSLLETEDYGDSDREAGPKTLGRGARRDTA